jgi:hypothetical protein
MALAVSVTVFRGLGGEQVSISGFDLTLDGVVLHLEEHTDWLWGIGNAFEFVDMASLAVIELDHIFGSEEPTEVLLHYLPYRITSMGFPCSQCWKWVSWDDPIWYTRYNHASVDPLNYPFLYRPRVYFCSVCGAIEPDLSGRLERADRDPVTNCVSYSISLQLLYPSSIHRILT